MLCANHSNSLTDALLLVTSVPPSVSPPSFPSPCSFFSVLAVERNLITLGLDANRNVRSFD